VTISPPTFQDVRIITGNGQQGRDATCSLNSGGQGWTIGTDNLVRADRIARQCDLVPGGQDRDTGSAPDRQPGNVHCSDCADIAGGQASACGDQRVTFCKVKPGFAPIGSARGTFQHSDAPGGLVSAGIFLDDDCIGPGGQGRAGEYPHACAWLDRDIM